MRLPPPLTPIYIHSPFQFTSVLSLLPLVRLSRSAGDPPTHTVKCPRKMALNDDQFLQNLRACKAEQQMLTVSPSITVPETSDSYDTVVFIDEEIFSLETMERVSGKAASMTDWKDFRPGNHECLNLRYIDSDAEIVKLGYQTFSSMKSVIHLRNVGNLLLLAYNLRDRAGNRLFDKVPVELQDTRKTEEFENLSDTVLMSTRSTKGWIEVLPLTTPDRERKLAAGYCYLAASYLMLYAKPFPKYLMMGNQLKNRFKAFYGFPLPFDNFHPEEEYAVLIIKANLVNHDRVKATFYNLLYAGENCGYGRNIKDFLYVMHVSCMGIHSYTLFSSCLEALKVSSLCLAALFYSKEFETEVDTIWIIFNNLYGKKDCDEYKNQMWRFARVFDHEFLSGLQTKKCKLFTAALANLSKLCGAQGPNQDVMKLAQLANMGEWLTRRAEEIARRVHLDITSLKAAQKNSSEESMNDQESRKRPKIF